jgi:hypothetical protein
MMLLWLSTKSACRRRSCQDEHYKAAVAARPEVGVERSALFSLPGARRSEDRASGTMGQFTSMVVGSTG